MEIPYDDEDSWRWRARNAERMQKLPCIDCNGTGKCGCGDCKGETCLLCGGTGRSVLLTLDDVATAMRRLGQRVRDAEAEAKRYRESDDAVGQIHDLCRDAGIPVGHVVDRVRQLVEAKDAEIAQLRSTLDNAIDRMHSREMSESKAQTDRSIAQASAQQQRQEKEAVTDRLINCDIEIGRLHNEVARLRYAAKSRLKCPEGHSPGESRGACWFCDAEANAAEITRMREAIGRLPAYRHASNCTTALAVTFPRPMCSCGADTANAARTAARKAAGLEP